MVAPGGDWAARLQRAGWQLDEGRAHAGQGTRNRRVFWQSSYLELLWVTDHAEAGANSVRLDRRADWVGSGASPFGFGLRGRLSEGALGEFWRYDGLGAPIRIHRDNERHPERPLVFVIESARQRPTSWRTAAPARCARCTSAARLRRPCRPTPDRRSSTRWAHRAWPSP